MWATRRKWFSNYDKAWIFQIISPFFIGLSLLINKEIPEIIALWVWKRSLLFQPRLNGELIAYGRFFCIQTEYWTNQRESPPFEKTAYFFAQKYLHQISTTSFFFLNFISIHPLRFTSFLLRPYSISFPGSVFLYESSLKTHLSWKKHTHTHLYTVAINVRNPCNRNTMHQHNVNNLK